MSYGVRSSVQRFRGPIFEVVTDDVEMPDGRVAARDYVRHLGAVAVVAVDEDGKVVLVHQYRHPVRAFLWELPAGLADVPGEDPVQAAARELAEEAGLQAQRWYRLADVRTSPGYSDERVQIFLALDLSPATARGFEPENEELELTVERLDLDKAADMVFTGEIANAATTVGLLAAVRARSTGWDRLRTL
jgi:8-oxo-dGDP phosphatase